MTDQFDFVLAVESQFYLLFITVGVILFIPSLIDVKNLKLGDEKSRKTAFFLGIAFFFVGSLIGFYPNTVEVSGDVTLKDRNASVSGAIVTINAISKVVDDNGHFCFSDVPKNSNFIEYRFHGVTHKKIINIPFWMAFYDYYVSYEFDFPPIQLQGKIINSSGGQIPLSISVTPFGCTGKDSYECLSNNYGNYNITVPCENPVTIDVWDKSKKGMAAILLRSKIVKFSGEDIDRGFKQVDINIEKTIDVEGSVMRYRDGLEDNPIPVIGAKIYVDGRANTTNNSGWYLLRNVPRGETGYRLKLISGNWNNDTIIPPLKDESEDETKTVRNIYINA